MLKTIELVPGEIELRVCPEYEAGPYTDQPDGSVVPVLLNRADALALVGAIVDASQEDETVRLEVVRLA